MKMIFEIGPRVRAADGARASARASESGETADLRRFFESARSLFSQISPARIDLLETLRRKGPCTVYALAKSAGRNYSNVHSDVASLIEIGLIERTPDKRVMVPFSAVEIRVPLAAEA